MKTKIGIKTETGAGNDDQTGQWMKFGNPLIKQGNSYCIRVPSNLVKELNIQEGDMMAMKMQKLDMTQRPEYLNTLFAKVRPLSELKNYSDDKLIVVLTLLTRQGKAVSESKEYKELIGNANLDEKKKKEYAKKVKEELDNFYSRLSKDFGKEFLPEYQRAIEIIGRKGLN